MATLNKCKCGGSPFLYENHSYCIVYCRSCESSTPTGNKSEVIGFWNGTSTAPPERGTAPMKIIKAHQKADAKRSYR